MKKVLAMTVVAAAALFAGLREANAQYGSCGADVGCGVADCYGGGEISCAPTCGDDVGCGVYGDDGCGDYCDICYGGCCGVSGIFSGIASVVATPFHWIADLFTCGTFADCGCAPPYEECYSDPCDCCGNYVGDGTCGGNPYYGYQGYYAATGQPNPDVQYAANGRQNPAAVQNRQNPNLNAYNSTEVNESADYLNYDKIETIGQKKIRHGSTQAARSMKHVPQARNGYMYQEKVVQIQPNVKNAQPVPSVETNRIPQKTAMAPVFSRQVSPKRAAAQQRARQINAQMHQNGTYIR